MNKCPQCERCTETKGEYRATYYCELKKQKTESYVSCMYFKKKEEKKNAEQTK